jgi:hypothetical protein
VLARVEALSWMLEVEAVGTKNPRDPLARLVEVGGLERHMSCERQSRRHGPALVSAALSGTRRIFVAVCG